MVRVRVSPTTREHWDLLVMEMVHNRQYVRYEEEVLSAAIEKLNEWLKNQLT